MDRGKNRLPGYAQPNLLSQIFSHLLSTSFFPLTLVYIRLELLEASSLNTASILDFFSLENSIVIVEYHCMITMKCFRASAAVSICVDIWILFVLLCVVKHPRFVDEKYFNFLET